MKTLIIIFCSFMKKNTRYYPFSSVIFSLALISSGIWIPCLVSTCYAQGPWKQKEAKMPTSRLEIATSVVDGKIYAIGGGGANYQPLNTVEEYDPVTDTWSKKKDMPTARQGLSTSVVNGKIYAIGGGDLTEYFPPTYLVTTLSVVEEYDPVTDTWTTKTQMPTARGWHSANVLDGKIYVIGGSSAAPYAGTAILAVEVYDPATDTWTQKGNIPRRIGGGFTSVVDGKIYAFGGYGGLEKVHEYDPVMDTWIHKTDMPTKRCGLSTSALDGKIYAIGGHPGVSPYLALATVEIYDPATDIWTTTTDMLTGRAGVRTSVVNGKIYAIGGYTGTWFSEMCVTVEEYDPHLDLIRLVGKTDVDKRYAIAGFDSVWITTKISDSTGITLLAEIEAPDQSPVDSLQLFDDGNHNDGNAGDGLYANVWQVNPTEERQYFVDLRVTRIGSDTLIQHLDNMATFTTIGPVVYDGLTFGSSDTIFDPGDRLEITLTLKNNGSTVTAPNITAKIISLDPLVSVSELYRMFGDIAAGEASTSSYYSIKISEKWTGISQVPIQVKISSNDYAYWKDTFYIPVQGPTYIKVLDRATKKSINRAIVKYGDNTTLSNEDGLVLIQNLPSEKLIFSVEHSDYFPLEDSAALRTGDTLEIALTKLRARIAFKVNDEKGPVANQSIRMGKYKVQTDKDGMASFLNRPARSSYGYNIERTCYLPVFDSLYLETDTLILINLETDISLPVVDIVTTDDTLRISSSKTGDLCVVPPGTERQIDSILANSYITVSVVIDEPVSVNKNDLPVFEYWIYVIDQCGNVSEELKFIVGSEEFLLNNIRIYPNPANNVLNIEKENTGNQEFDIEILNIIGKLIYQKEYKKTNAHFVKQIDLSGYVKGIYLVKVRQANTVYVGKVVVK